jgi:hypothetical protein
MTKSMAIPAVLLLGLIYLPPAWGAASQQEYERARSRATATA